MPATRETIELGGTATHGGAGQIQILVAHPARIVRVALRFYPGPELSLQVTPYILFRDFLQKIIRRGDGQPAYLAGENDLMDFQCDFPVDAGAYLVAAWANTDAVNDYDFAMPVTLTSR